MSTPTFADAVILGGGVSGQLLARELAASRWSRGRRIVVVDRAGADLSGRRWAYWSGVAEPDAWRGWGQIGLHLAGRSWTRPLMRHRYWQVRGEDLSRRSRRLWQGRVRVLRAQAVSVTAAEGDQCLVTTDAGELRARWVFDGVLAAQPAAHTRLWFTGACVRSGPDGVGPVVDDPDVVLLADDRLGTPSPFGFGYVLPYSADEALVEVTRFAKERPAGLEADLGAFGSLRCPSARPVSWQESGSLALGRPGPRRTGRRVMTIGTPAGAVRASTGYGFTAMRADAAAVRASLEAHGHPFDVPGRRRRHTWADAVLLDLMGRDPEAVSEVFAALFDTPDVDTVLDFLDGRTRLAAELAILRRLPTHALAAAARMRTAAAIRGRWVG